MLKKIVKKSFSGAMLGIFMGLVISIIFSYLNGSGFYYPSTPKFMEQFSNQSTAMVVSLLLWSILGGFPSGAALIFQVTDWSITKMTIVNFIFCYGSFISVALLSQWIKLDVLQIGTFTFIYISIYVAIWLFIMNSVKKQLVEMNQMIQERK
ncbi:DUF3021 domain-containing protein [Enterococcus sp. LJL99]